MVSALATLEGLFDFDLRPERIVRRGGYTSVEEGVEDMLEGLRSEWQARQ